MLRTEALRVFVTVAECGNIKDAADRLFRTQSAISMTLKQVEDQLGAPLFETDRKHSLTDLGQFVQGVATVLLRDHDSAVALIETYAKGNSGRLRLASVPSVAARLIPDLLRGFLASRPEAQVDLVDTDSADVRHLVATGQADLGIGSPAGIEETLLYTPLFQDQLKLVCRTDSAFATLPHPLTWSDVASATWILNETTRLISTPDFLAIAANAKLRVRNVTSLLAMVQAHVGVTLLPGLATLALPADLCALPLADASCCRAVGILQREGRVQSPIALGFQRYLVNSIPSLAAQYNLTAMLASGAS